MISIFGNEPLTLPAKTAVAPTAPSKQPAAINKIPSRAAAPEPWRPFKWLSFARTKKRLKMLETVSLGEKRFVALVQVDGRQFLIGGAPNNVGMLAELAPEESFQQVLEDATRGLDIPETAAIATVEASANKAEPAAMRVKVPIDEAAVSETKKESFADLEAPGLPVSSPIFTVPTESAVASEKLVRGPDPVDLAFEEPVSLSPSLLAAMETNRMVKEAYAPPVSEQEVSSVAPVQRVAEVPAEVQVKAVEPQPEPLALGPLELKPAETAIAKQQDAEPLPVEQVAAPISKPSPFLSVPGFTFQFSHIFGLNPRPVTRPAVERTDAKTALRIAAMWNLQGATS